MQRSIASLVCTLALACCAPAAETSVTSAQAPAVPRASAQPFDHTHGAWSALLAAHLRAGRVDYAALKKDPAPLDAYLTSLESVTAKELRGWSREQRMAFWINAYNAYTVRRVVEGYPTKSIKDLGGLLRSVWDQRFIPLRELDPKGKGRKLSLNDIEHEILRKRFRDPRVHAALNCASASCPPLREEAFVAARLDEQLDDQMRRWLADPTRNRFDAEHRLAELSKIFQWYGEDFGRNEGERLAFLVRFAPPGAADWLAGPGVVVRYLDYDWSLNDVPRPKRP